MTESLDFGTVKLEELVSAEEWEAFVSTVITPAFQDGLSTWVAAGQWRMANGTVQHETAHVLQLTHDDSHKNDTAIQNIMKTYKDNFEQEAVMRVRSKACRSF